MTSTSIPSFESFNCEFKREWNKDKIRKVIVSFANTVGGDLYIGVDDEGIPVGLTDIDQVGQSLASVLSDSVFPPMTDCVTMTPTCCDGKNVLHVHIDRGPHRPYSVKLGDPSGVYLRVGNTSKPATIDEIAQIVRGTNPVPYEDRAAVEQNLTFVYTQKILQENHIVFNPKINQDFGFITHYGRLFTNTAYFFSDQCEKSVRLLRFNDDEQLDLRSTEIIQGSVFEVIDNTLKILAGDNLARMEKPSDGTAQRIDRFFVAPEALREAVVNVAAHRDYGREAPTVIAVTPSAIELTSPGSLADGFELEDILSPAVTVCRNKHLAQLLCRVHYMESSGTGFRLIRATYPQLNLKDIISVTPSTFRIRLPKQQPAVVPKSMPEPDKALLRLFNGRTSLTRTDIETLLNQGRTTTANQLKRLTVMGLIEKIGGGRSSAYRLHPQPL